MTEDQSLMHFIKDYWVQLVFLVAYIVGWSNLKFRVRENSEDILDIKAIHAKLEDKIENKLDSQATDIKNILIMLGDIKRGTDK